MPLLVLIALGATAVAQPQPQPKPPAQRPRQPDPAVTYSVPLDDSPSEGPKHAKVTIVMGMEFACPFCRRSWDTLAALRKQYGDDVRIVYKMFVVHREPGTATALAACAAQQGGKWRAMADALWSKAFDKRDFGVTNLLAIGRSVGLDTAVMDADMHSAVCAAQLLRDMTELTRLGQNGTPTFWINGRILVGAQPIERFQALVDEELKKADAALAAGVKLADYYDTLVKTGATSP